MVVLKALLRQWQDRCANDANVADRRIVTSKTISETALEVLKEDESDLAEGDGTAQKIGPMLNKRRIKKLKRERSRGSHHWDVTQGARSAWARAHGLRGVLEDAPLSDADMHPSEDAGANEIEREVFEL